MTRACHRLHLFSRWPNNGCCVPGLNIIINVASWYVWCTCLFVCARVYVWKNRHLGNAFVVRLLFALLRTFSHGLPHGSLRGSNASRQSVFYCVYAQEASIINLDHDLLPSVFDPRALSLSVLQLSLRPHFLSFPPSLSSPLSLALSLILWVSSVFCQKETARCKTTFIPLRKMLISSNPPHTIVFHSMWFELHLTKF